MGAGVGGTVGGGGATDEEVVVEGLCNRETRGSRSAGTETGGECPGASVAEEINVSRHAPDDSPARLYNPSADDSIGGNGSSNTNTSANSSNAQLPSSAGGGRLGAGGRAQAAVAVNRRQRSALECLGWDHGRERGSSRRGEGRGGVSAFPALGRPKEEGGAAAHLAPAASVEGG